MAAIRALIEVVLVVEDIDRSLAFFRDTLGLPLISPPALPVKFLRIDPERDGLPQQVVLIPRSLAGDQPLARTRSQHHIGLEVAPGGYDRERARLAGLGFEIRAGNTHSCRWMRSTSTIRTGTRSRSRPGGVDDCRPQREPQARRGSRERGRVSTA